MQGWMKSVLGAAAGSGDAKQLAKALKEVAAKPVAGFDQWVAISNEGAAKADAGDIDGAKQSCKKCHSLYQKKYREEMRDKPW
jgi:soluble cytochrome b562